MSLKIKRRISSFGEIRFLSKSQSLVADLKRSIPRLLKSKLLRLVNNNYINKEAGYFLFQTLLYSLSFVLRSNIKKMKDKMITAKPTNK